MLGFYVVSCSTAEPRLSLIYIYILFVGCVKSDKFTVPIPPDFCLELGEHIDRSSVSVLPFKN